MKRTRKEPEKSQVKQNELCRRVILYALNNILNTKYWYIKKQLNRLFSENVTKNESILD